MVWCSLLWLETSQGGEGGHGDMIAEGPGQGMAVWCPSGERAVHHLEPKESFPPRSLGRRRTKEGGVFIEVLGAAVWVGHRGT